MCAVILAILCHVSPKDETLKRPATTPTLLRWENAKKGTFNQSLALHPAMTFIFITSILITLFNKPLEPWLGPHRADDRRKQ